MEPKRVSPQPATNKKPVVVKKAAPLVAPAEAKPAEAKSLEPKPAQKKPAEVNPTVKKVVKNVAAKGEVRVDAATTPSEEAPSFAFDSGSSGQGSRRTMNASSSSGGSSKVARPKKKQAIPPAVLFGGIGVAAVLLIGLVVALSSGGSSRRKPANTSRSSKAPAEEAWWDQKTPSIGYKKGQIQKRKPTAADAERLKSFHVDQDK